MNKGTLYLIPSELAPASGHAYITEELKSVVKSIQHFAVENVRTSRRFVSSLKLGLVIESLDFKVLSKKTKPLEIKDILSPLFDGHNVGILSEAGCPGVADPGSEAVKMAHNFGIKVVPLVGPSSILLALMGSGLNGQSFAFHGYLPIAPQELGKKVALLESESRKNAVTQIFIETPYRNNKLASMLVQRLSNDTMLCIAKNLTAEDQWIETKAVKDWKDNLPELHKIPAVFLFLAQ